MICYVLIKLLFIVVILQFQKRYYLDLRGQITELKSNIAYTSNVIILRPRDDYT